MNEAKGFDGYIAAQEHSLRELRCLPEFMLIEAIDAPTIVRSAFSYRIRHRSFSSFSSLAVKPFSRQR